MLFYVSLYTYIFHSKQYTSVLHFSRSILYSIYKEILAGKKKQKKKNAFDKYIFDKWNCLIYQM